MLGTQRSGMHLRFVERARVHRLSVDVFFFSVTMYVRVSITSFVSAKAAPLATQIQLATNLINYARERICPSRSAGKTMRRRLFLLMQASLILTHTALWASLSAFCRLFLSAIALF